ncbi:MAG: 30S ribosomal protein S6 [Clostridia bacterium]
MAKINGTYETIFIVDLSIGEDQVKSTVEKFTSLIEANATDVTVTEWGKRRLAYPINDLNDGHYVLVDFSSKTDFPAELDRVYKITEGLMRSIIIAK